MAYKRHASAAARYNSGVPSLHNGEDIERLIERDVDMMALLSAAASLALPDWLISAGFVRNAVWDVLHGQQFVCRSLRDVDVVYFDAEQRDPASEAEYEAQLRKLVPWAEWEVRNQARMHERNGDPPYRDTAHAIAQYPETATAVGVRLTQRVELVAPLGIADMLGMVVRPTPHFRSKMPQYRARQLKKNWASRWSKLRFED